MLKENLTSIAVNCLKITEDKSLDKRVHASDVMLIKSTRAKPRRRFEARVSTPLQCQDAELKACVSVPLQCSAQNLQHASELEPRVTNAKLEARV